MKSIQINAYAKINLGLRILSKRLDGYHELITVFQRISLADRVILEKLVGGIEYLGPTLTEKPEDNLCCIAAEMFRSLFGMELGVRIRLDKTIPTGAGLGGGSSDAAAVLRGMCEMYGISPTHEDLINAAAEIGSDVPFFFSDLSSALGQGRGEKITPVNGLSKNYYLLVLKPNYSISTAWAYSELDNILTFEKNNISIVSHNFLSYSGGAPSTKMTNDFECLVLDAHPELAEARAGLLDAGAEFAGLCGSGSAVFGAFSDDCQVQAIAGNWRSPWLKLLCRPL